MFIPKNSFNKLKIYVVGTDVSLSMWLTTFKP